MDKILEKAKELRIAIEETMTTPRRKGRRSLWRGGSRYRLSRALKGATHHEITLA